MTKKLYGVATIRFNGRELDTRGNATLMPGGMERTTNTDSHRTGRYTEKEIGAKLECEVNYGEGDSLGDYDVLAATVEFRTDTGQTYVIRDAYRTGEPPKIEDGKVSLVVEGPPAEEMI